MAEVPSGFQVAKYGGVNTVQCDSLAVGWTGMTEAAAESASMSLASTLIEDGNDGLLSALT